MRQQPVTVSTLCVPLLLIVLLLVGLVPLSSTSLQRAAAASPPVITSITGNTVTGNFSTQVLPPSGNVYGIQGGQTVGTNLFHSFGQFNVGPGDVAQFQTSNLTPNASISNILGRVTGQQSPSNIFGTIDSATYYPSANLFLMNPYGFLFGPNATVNVGGMVAFTSADYLRLQGTGGNGIFYADPAKTNILTSAPVAAFGFLGSNPGAITVQGSQLSVTPGQSLSLAGGNITVQSGVLDDGVTIQPARLSAPGGQINLASVASPGEILFSNLQLAPNINGQSFTAMGNITLSQGALLEVSADAAGTIRIRGGKLEIADATLSADTVNAEGAQFAININVTGDVSITDSTGIPAITARTFGAGNAGEVRISSGSFSASTTVPELMFHTLIDAHSAGTGAAGSVNISTGDLNITGPGPESFNVIDTGPQGDGPGGNVTLNAQSIEMTGALITTGTKTAVDLFTQGLLTELPNGSAGNLIINAGTFLGSRASVSATGDTSFGSTTQHGGDVTLNVHDWHSTDSSSIDVTGNSGGGITIIADTFIMDASQLQAFSSFGTGKAITFNGRILELSNGSTWATSTFGDGAAGDIRVSASDHVSLNGQTDPNSFVTGNPTGIFSNSFGFFGTQGNAGNIVLITPRLTMDQGRINTTTLSSGNGGNVTINANVVKMSGELPQGAGGDFFFFDVGNVHPSGIFTQTIGSDFCAGPCGNAGNINIATGSLTMGSGSQVNTGTTNSGEGGHITIHAANTISMSGTLSDGNPVGVFSRSVGTTPDAGSGGNISLTAGQSISSSSDAAISASSTGPGNAGNIHINAGQQLDMRDSSIKTEAAHASGGNIDIQAVDQVRLVNSTISTSVLGGGGSGGNISIDPNVVVLQNSQVIAQAVQGAGGNITITTPLFLADQTSLVSASSEFGLNGTVTIQSPTSNLSESLGPLPSSMLDQQALQAQRCAASHGGASSSFIIAGRDTVPTEPGGWLASSLGLHSLGRSLLADTMIDEQPPTTLVMTEASESISLRRLTPIGFLTQRFAGNGSDGCRS